MHHFLNKVQIRIVLEIICAERLGEISRWAAKNAHTKEDILFMWHMVV